MGASAINQGEGSIASLVSTLQVIHVLAAILMAWPFYALVAVNERRRLGPPLGDRLDIYLENVVRDRVIPCSIFQATVMGTSLALDRTLVDVAGSVNGGAYGKAPSSKR